MWHNQHDPFLFVWSDWQQLLSAIYVSGILHICWWLWWRWMNCKREKCTNVINHRYSEHTFSKRFYIFCFLSIMNDGNLLFPLSYYFRMNRLWLCVWHVILLRWLLLSLWIRLGFHLQAISHCQLKFSMICDTWLAVLSCYCCFLPPLMSSAMYKCTYGASVYFNIMQRLVLYKVKTILLWIYCVEILY